MFYFCTLTEVLGDYEFPCKFLTESNSIDMDIVEICIDFRNGVLDENDTVWSDNIAINVGDVSYRSITTEEFNVLKEFLTVL